MSTCDIPLYIFIRMSDQNEKAVTHNNDLSSPHEEDCSNTIMEAVTATSNHRKFGKV
jgi:hypothetical protein